MWGARHLCGRRRTSRTLRLNHKTLEHLLNLLVQPCCHFVRVRSLSLWRAACSSLSPLCVHRVARVVAQCSWPYSTSITLPSCHFARRRAHFAFARAPPPSLCACAHSDIALAPLIFLRVLDRSRCGAASLAQP
jgi:hypothetical protein